MLMYQTRRTYQNSNNIAVVHLLEPVWR
ncbi:TPA: hypothetical protein ACM37C_003739 [Escherichia coli]|nr:hypothetical protein [Escherichia coli]MCZ0583922.1 hypothetical protein [Escherichia coli]